MDEYFQSIGNDINDFMTNVVYYSPTGGLYDMEDNHIWNYHFEVTDVPNVTPEIRNTIDEYFGHSLEKKK